VTALAGAAVMAYAWKALQLGTLRVPDAGLLPFLCGMGLAILGILWFLTLPTQEDLACGVGEERPFWHRPLVSLILMALYAWTMEALGYLTATLLFMAAWQKIVERERWGKALLITVLGTAAMYALFRMFLKVPIPQELFLR
jgi:hypothetical protein